jgi:uncharacterized protein (DUF2336 family)
VIEVAGPVLSQSARLDDKTLIENARSKSQAHLMAISTRKVLSSAVTDVLVQRGNDEVIQSTVNNPGAEFTERGFTRLVNRADGDDNLATCVGLRPNIPRHHYLKLLAKASDIVRQRLEAAHPQQADQVPTAVKEATRRARSASSAITRNTEIAHALVKSLYEDGRLDEFQVATFAEAGKFDEANASIAALANVPVAVAENMMIETRADCRGRPCGPSSTCATISPAASRPISRRARIPTNGCGHRPRSRSCASTACNRTHRRRECNVSSLRTHGPIPRDLSISPGS